MWKQRQRRKVKGEDQANLARSRGAREIPGGKSGKNKERLPSRRPFPLNTNQLNNTSQVSGKSVL